MKPGPQAGAGAAGTLLPVTALAVPAAAPVAVPTAPPTIAPTGPAAAPPAAAPAAPPAAAEDVVARVNGRPILRRDFELAVQLQFGGRRRQAVGLEQLRATREQVLETLIDGEIFQDAYQQPLNPDSEIVLIPKIGGG